MSRIGPVRDAIAWTAVSASILLVVGIVGWAAVHAPHLRVAPGVTTKSIKMLTLGMNQEQVEDVLGKPLAIRSWGRDGVILDYAVPHLWALWSPSLWIYFRDGHVQEIHAKRYGPLLSEHAVYNLRPDLVFEAADFESTFRRW